MTGEDVRKLTSEELLVEANRLRDRLFTLRGQKTTEKVEDTSQFEKIRRDIARLRTEATARLHGAKEPAGERPGEAARHVKRKRASRKARVKVGAVKAKAKKRTGGRSAKASGSAKGGTKMRKRGRSSSGG